VFIFAHTGITLGAALLLDRLLPYKAVGTGVAAGAGNPAPAGGDEPPDRVKGMDYRLVLLGSMLPDLIDKPLGLLAPGLGLGTGRGIAHTLVFALVLLVGGLFFYGAGRRGLLHVALASAGHLVLDCIWQLPRVLFWPLYGFTFPTVGRSGILSQLAAWWHTLWTTPGVFIPEIIGVAIILAFALRLRRRGVFSKFIKSGMAPWL